MTAKAHLEKRKEKMRKREGLHNEETKEGKKAREEGK